ncbi:MAG TPA: S41 family peptidase [Candidatus Polarisedimenticolia bacterium]|jgi:carboxyl-terminal processing protease|nr:S41 family peptidase [Candidatus Polarisedimenticolia bacterium]
MKITADRKLMLVLSTALVLFSVSGAMMGRVVAVEGTYSYLKLFNEALYLIVHNYVQPVQLDGLMEGAYRGMLESLDPVNEYLSPVQYEKAFRGDAGGPAGAGLTLSKRRGYLVVVSVQAGSPAAEAGMQTGDVVVMIDGRSTRLMGVWEASRALRGKPSTKVTLNVSPVAAAGRKTIELTRRTLAPPAPSGTLEAPDAGVVRVAALQEGDAKRLDQAIAGLKKRGAARLLLDLRGCSSDSLAEGIGAASLFINDGTIVTVTDRYDGDKAYKADGRRRVWSGPLVVLVNEGTSGACEVLAAALHDDRSAPIVGQKTWGEGAVRALLPLQQGDGIFLATGRLQSPSGKEWHGQGIQPDLAIEGRPTDSDDPQLKKAIEYLRGVSRPADRNAA